MTPQRPEQPERTERHPLAAAVGAGTALLAAGAVLHLTGQATPGNAV
jgi:hypothetical protein